MSDLTTNIQTIAKTQLIEQKLGQALAQSDATLNNDVSNSQVQTERAIGIADGSTSSGTTTNNTTTVVVDGGSSNTTAGDFNLGYIPAAQDNSGSPNSTDAGNQSLAALSGGLTAAQDAAQQVAAANSILNQQLSSNAGQQSAIKDYNTTDQTKSVTVATGGSSNTGGSDAYMVATNGTGYNVATSTTGDQVLSALQSSAVYQASSIADQGDFTKNYIDQNYNSPGNITVDQFTSNNYSPNYNPSQQPLNSVIGYDPNGTISLATGAILAIKIQLRGDYPIPTSLDALANDQVAWTNANDPPTYTPPSYQVGYYWTCQNGSGTTAYSQTVSSVIDSGLAYAQTLMPPGATYTGFKGLFNPATSTYYTVSEATTFATLFPAGVSLDFRYNYVNGMTSSFINLTGGFTKCPTSDPGPGNIHNMCFIGPPTPVTATGWPQTGLSLLTLTNGSIGYSPYDTELPAYLKTSSSVIRLNGGDGVHTINTNYLTAQPGVNGGLVLSAYNASGTFLFANYYDASGLLKNPQMTQQQTNYFIP